MGAASGKLIIQPVPQNHQATEKANEEHNAAAKETASQLVNGDANAVSHIPSIDEDTEPAVEKSIEEPVEAVIEAASPNGTVNATEPSPSSEKKDKQKNKNPITWMKRRFSKRSVSKQASDDVPDEAQTDAAEVVAPVEGETVEVTMDGDKPTEAEVTETAGSLVEEVLNSALSANAEAEQQAEESAVIPEVPERAPTPVEEPQVETVPTTLPEPVEQEVPVESSTIETSAVEERPIINGNHVEEPVDETSVLDTNNTNGVDSTHHDNGEEEETTHDLSAQPNDEAMATKLAGLELTNGHSTHECENSTAVAVNGD